jgi:FdhD protein
LTTPRRLTTLRAVEQNSLCDGTATRRVRRDELAAEEPLEIRVVASDGVGHRVAVTMRTPGADFELAAGFLYGEGLIGGAADVSAIRYCVERGAEPQRYNVVSVHLAPGAAFDPASVQRNFYVSSSCGVCGKASIEAALGSACDRVAAALEVAPEVLLSLPPKLRTAQPLFERTGGLHAAGLFDADGGLLRAREDVGRHNAMDKLVGALAAAGEDPGNDISRGFILSTARCSYEIVEKAVRAGATRLVTVSLPTSMAVERAKEAGLSLWSLARDDSVLMVNEGM